MNTWLMILMLGLWQPPPPAHVIIQTASGSVEVFPALSTTLDNRQAIQNAIDWCEVQPGRETILFPPGVWKVSAPVEIVGNVEYVCEGVTLEPLDPLTFAKSVVVAGASDWGAPGAGTRPRADNVSIIGLTIRQTAATSQHSHCIFVGLGDNWRLTRVKVIGAKHEGLASSTFTRNWVFDRVEAEDCGFGSEHRGQSAAGINAKGFNHVFVDCTTTNCTQGFEYGGSRSTFIRCKAMNGNAGLQGPSIGFSFGSTGMGLYRARLIDCESSGHSSALQIGNVIGRVSGISVENFNAVDGSIAFTGGTQNNNVPSADEGPDLEPNTFIRCKVSTASPNGITGIICSASGINELGRAPVDFVDCVVEMPNVTDANALGGNRPFAVNGNYTGSVTFLRPVLKGLPNPNINTGDFRQAADGMTTPARLPNVKVIDGRAYRADGTERHFRQHWDAGE